MSVIKISTIRAVARYVSAACVIAVVLAAAEAVAQTAPMQEAAWPQRFQLVAPQVAVFGFAASQPGTVSIDVQLQSGAVDVALAGLSGASVHQAGQGAVHLVYQITAQDVQKSSLWQVRVAPQSAGPIAGIISVQHPAANAAALQTELTGLTAKNNAALVPQLQQPNTAAMTAAVSQAQARIANFEKQKSDAITAAHAQLPALTQRLAAQPRIGTRALPPAPVAQRAPTAGAAVPSQAIQATQAAKPVLPPTIASAQVTALFDSSGRPLAAAIPGMPILIVGSGFGSTAGYVTLNLGPGQVFNATINAWSDTVISVDVPSVTGVVDTPSAQMFLVREGISSPAIALAFQAEREMRLITSSTDHFLAAPAPIGPVGNIRLNFNPFSQMTGTDQWLQNSHLTNNWVVVSTVLNTLVPSSLASMADGNTTLIANQNGSPGFAVQWYAGAAKVTALTVFTGVFTPSLVSYAFLTTISGPKGTRDGITN